MSTDPQRATNGGAPERPVKPAPERTSPIRAWRGLTPTGGGAARPGSGSGREEPAAHPETGGSPEPPVADGPAGGVASGYRVIDDYLTQGREAAARLGLGSAEGFTAAGSFQTLTARLFQDGLLWLEHLSKLAAVPAAEEPTQRAPEAEVPQGRVRVRVASRQPAEVDLRLHAGAAAGSYGVHDLRAPDPASPAIDDVRLEQRGGDWLLQLRIADAQPAGLYTGVVFDRRDGSVRGTLAVRVGDEEGGA